MIRPRQHKSGLTLVELLVAVGLLSIVLGIAYRLAADSSRILRDQQRLSRSARGGWEWLHKVSQELRTILPPEAAGPDGALEGRDGSITLYDAAPDHFRNGPDAAKLKAVRLESDVIRFPVARLNLGAGPPAAAVIEYALKRDAEGRVAGVARRTAALGAPREQSVERLDNTHVVSIDCQYLDGDGRWLPEWRQASRLPTAVRITVAALVPQSGRPPRPARFTTVVFLPAGTRIAAQ